MSDDPTKKTIQGMLSKLERDEVEMSGLDLDEDFRSNQAPNFDHR